MRHICLLFAWAMLAVTSAKYVENSEVDYSKIGVYPCNKELEGKTYSIIGLNDAYYLCVNGESLYKECPKKERFDADASICVPDQSYKKGPCSKELEGKNYSIENVCDAYYQCQEGELVYRECPDFTIYDVSSRQCEPYDELINVFKNIDFQIRNLYTDEPVHHQGDDNFDEKNTKPSHGYDLPNGYQLKKHNPKVPALGIFSPHSPAQSNDKKDYDKRS